MTDMTDLDDAITTLTNSLRVLDKSARYVRNLYVTETLIFCALLDYLPEVTAQKIARRYAPRWETLTHAYPEYPMRVRHSPMWQGLKRHDFQYRLTRLVVRVQARL